MLPNLTPRIITLQPNNQIEPRYLTIITRIVL
jgi:hypothetical protein